MTGGMAAFALGDFFLKLVFVTLPVPQVVFVFASGSAMIFTAVALLRGERLLDRRALSGVVALRCAAEVVAALSITTGLALSPLSTATALLQAVPLVAMAGAALVLGERVGWRRWASAAVGLLGVVVILRPAGGIAPGLLLVLLGVLALAARDLATRRTDPGLSSVVLSVYTFISLSLAAGLWTAFGTTPVRPDSAALALLAAITLSVALASFLVTASLRQGEVSVIVPFRYTRLLFALVLAVAFLGERPDGLVYFGAALVIGSGLYALWREQAASRPA